MAKISILLANLGTPAAPTPEAVSTYLGQFLSDERVIDVPRLIWTPLLKWIRFKRSPGVSHTYQSVWLPEGSPILVISESQAAKLKQALVKAYPQHEFDVRVGMSYGEPSMERITRETINGVGNNFAKSADFARQHALATGVDSGIIGLTKAKLAEFLAGDDFNVPSAKHSLAYQADTQALAQNHPSKPKQWLSNNDGVTGNTVYQENFPDYVVCFPLYPQFSSTTVMSVIDAFNRAYAHKNQRSLPPFSMVNHYHRNSKYIKAIADSIRTQVRLQQEQAEQKQAQAGESVHAESSNDWLEPDEYFSASNRLFLSYHGIPSRYIAEHNDPYPLHCEQTTKLVALELGLSPQQYVHTYQSVFGKEPWLEPKTDASLEAHAQKYAHTETKAQAMVICPCFSADCIETIEENGMVNRDAFIEAGGAGFSLVPCLNDQDDHIEMMVSVLEKHIALAEDYDY